MIALAFKDIDKDQQIPLEPEVDGVFEIEEQGFTLMGIIGIGDKVRKEVPNAIFQC